VAKKWRAVSFLQVEELEKKIVPSGMAYPTYVAFQHLGNSQPLAGGSTPPGLSPAQVRHAYGIDQIAFESNGSSVAGDGSGTTIAIVDANDDPSIANDLSVFDNQYGLPAPPSFIKVGLNSAGTASTTHFPAADSGWAGEIELDVEWAHAVAPKASILLVEAASASDTDLLRAVDYARHYSGVVAVSMSWGESEYSGQTANDSYFTTPAGHTGVTFLASAGDNGPPAIWPASSSHVVGVGGTTLNVSASGAYLSESGWSSSGGGPSQIVGLPSYQSNLVVHDGSQVVSEATRVGPDVAYVADPNTGVAVYGTYGWGGWAQIGGTSAGSPQWAGLIAIADQGLALAGNTSLDGFSQTLPNLYHLPSADFHDTTSGNNGYAAGPGFDMVTGLGTPVANRLVTDLAGNSAPPPTVVTPAQVLSSTTTSVTLNALGMDKAGAASLTYIWSVVGTPPGTVSFSPNGTNAAHTTTANLSAVGTYTFQVTITDPAGLTATSQVTFTLKPVATSVNVSPASATVADGGTRQFSATAEDQFGVNLALQPSFTWSVTAGVGSISNSGLYSAPASGSGSATVQASTGSLAVTASVTVLPLGGPSITSAPKASSQTPTTVALTVAATDAGGASGLIYTWSLAGTPPASVSFSSNASNAATTTTAAFAALGTYNFLVTVKDASNLTATSTVSVTVSPVLTSISVTPASVTLTAGATQQFSATGDDQFGHGLAVQPAFTWSVASGPGSITTAGLFTAGTGNATLQATSGSVHGQANVAVPGSSSTFSSSTHVPIYGGYVTYGYLNVNQNVTIGSLTTKIYVTYPYDGDLAIDLISPQGTDVALSYFEGIGRNFNGTKFSDAASMPIWMGVSPFAGTYQPETPLADVAGQNAHGTWTLAVSDYGYASGVVTSWSITVQPAPLVKPAAVPAEKGGGAPSGYAALAPERATMLPASPTDLQGKTSVPANMVAGSATGALAPETGFLNAGPSNAMRVDPKDTVAYGWETMSPIDASGPARPAASASPDHSGPFDAGQLLQQEPDASEAHENRPTSANAAERTPVETVFAVQSADESGAAAPADGLQQLQLYTQLAFILAGSWGAKAMEEVPRHVGRAARLEFVGLTI
jgi:subtilisin-like proprotein convertase family protein